LTNRLRVVRAERNLSQSDLAALAGVTRQTISSIETGQYVPSTLLAFTLARRLDLNVERLFALEGDVDVAHADRP
jgi:putative transcriptional regulator